MWINFRYLYSILPKKNPYTHQPTMKEIQFCFYQLWSFPGNHTKRNDISEYRHIVLTKYIWYLVFSNPQNKSKMKCKNVSISISALVVTMFAATFSSVSHYDYDIKMTTSEFALSRVCKDWMIVLSLVLQQPRYHSQSVSQDNNTTQQSRISLGNSGEDYFNSPSRFVLSTLPWSNLNSIMEKRIIATEQLSYFVWEFVFANSSTSFNLSQIKRYNTHKYYPKLPLFLQ